MKKIVEIAFVVLSTSSVAAIVRLWKSAVELSRSLGGAHGSSLGLSLSKFIIFCL